MQQIDQIFNGAYTCGEKSSKTRISRRTLKQLFIT